MKKVLYLIVAVVLVSSVQAATPLVDRSEFNGHAIKVNTADYEAGNRFTTGDNPPTVTALGFIDMDNTNVNAGTQGPNDGDGLKESHRVTLWRVSDQSKIAEVTVPAGTAGTLVDGFRYTDLVSPITLLPNTRYIVSARNGSPAGDAYVNATLTPGPVTPNTLFVGDTTDWTYIYSTPSNQYPTTTFEQSSFYGLANALGQALSPYDPVPTNNDTNVGTLNGAVADVDLAWKAGQDPAEVAPFNPAIKKHYVYLSADQNVSADPNLVYLGVVDQVSATDPNVGIAVAGLNLDGQYLWQVEEGLDNGSGGVYAAGDPNNIVGPVWTFDTLKSVPIIDVQPQDVLVDPNDPAVISITVSSISPETYQWYKSVDNANDTSGDDTPVPVIDGGQTDTVSYASAQIANEGFYYCEITNDGGATQVISDVAKLFTKRLIGHWKMDDNLDDSSVTGQWDGTYSIPTVTYDGSGVDGSALILSNDPNHVTIPNTEDVFNFFDLGITVSCWVKTADASWSGLVAKQVRVDPDPYTGFVFDLTPVGRVLFELRGVGSVTSPTDVTVIDNQWHMVTATYDGATGEMVVYVDAEQAVANTFTAVPRLAANPLVIGAEQVTGATPYGGLLDDVQIYTYAMANTEVLNLYNGYAGVDDKILCILPYENRFDVASPTSDITQPDFEADCKINLYDIAFFARGWISCGLYPNCP